MRKLENCILQIRCEWKIYHIRAWHRKGKKIQLEIGFIEEMRTT